MLFTCMSPLMSLEMRALGVRLVASLVRARVRPPLIQGLGVCASPSDVLIGQVHMALLGL